jgi:hypothetical protein
MNDMFAYICVFLLPPFLVVKFLMWLFPGYAQIILDVVLAIAGVILVAVILLCWIVSRKTTRWSKPGE